MVSYNSKSTSSRTMASAVLLGTLLCTLFLAFNAFNPLAVGVAQRDASTMMEPTNWDEVLRETVRTMQEKEKLNVQALQETDTDRAIAFAGILEDGAKITTEALSFLIDLNCNHNVLVHVLVKRNPQMLTALFDVTKPLAGNCTAFLSIQQPDFINLKENRVDRLKLARDFQRSEVKNMLSDYHLDDSVVVLADLDLSELPLSEEVVGHAFHVSEDGDVDILCAAGVVKNYEHEEEAYYDTFATVLLPDTFVYPLNGREVQEIRPEEDKSLILSKTFTPVDLLQWFKEKGEQGPGESPKPVPVKSCFGGLALYRASKWLEESCSYSMPAGDALIKYANRLDKTACEHVIFHSCLQEVDPQTMIAVQPDLRTRWHKPDSKRHQALAKSYAISKVPSLEKLIPKEKPFERRRNLRAKQQTEDSPSLRTPENQAALQHKLRSTTRRVESEKAKVEVEEEEKDRPVAIIHVGPRKTGSTAIQTSIRKYAAEFLEDNYITIANRVHWFSHCLASKTIDEGWLERCHQEDLKDLSGNVTLARKNQQNIIVSSESLDRVHKVDPTKMKEMFEGFDVHVVVAYRRFFEWAVSNYGQMYRHGDHDWDAWTPLPPKDARDIVGYLSPIRIQDQYQNFYTPQVYHLYKESGFHTQILNYHAEEDVVSTFFCLGEVNAPTVCDAVRHTKDEAPYSNRAVPISFDEIAVAAMEAGIIDGARVARPQAREAVRQYIEDIVMVDKEDLPKRCLQGESLELLEEMSMQAEAELLPAFHSSDMGGAALLRKFEQYMDTSFCSVDTDKILAEPKMVNFLSDIASYTLESESDPKKSETDTSPLAWLMSFPNSGTTYTMKMIQSITGKPAATNYVKETYKGEHPIPHTPVFSDQPEGPYWYSDPNESPRTEGEYILTKTHCGSRCNGCSPEDFEQSVVNFAADCASDENRDSQPYPMDNVHKAIHLVRDPIDNVVSRFHLRLKRGRTEVTSEWDNSEREHFRQYCSQEADTNANDNAVLEQSLTAEQFALLDKVPCRAEFLKYVTWHNRAFETCDDYSLDSLVVHYDDYENKFEETTNEIVEFLGMKKTQEPLTFEAGKIYGDFFTLEEKIAIKTVVKSLASEETWYHLEQYFDDVKTDPFQVLDDYLAKLEESGN